MRERDNVAPMSKIAKCRACGASARLDHILPHPVEPIEQFVYRCARCGETTVVERPRGPGAPDTQGSRDSI